MPDSITQKSRDVTMTDYRAELQRPDCFDFAMDFLGDPEAPEVIQYVEALEARARPAIEPVLVTERPWEREGWCDADGKCWWGRPSEKLWIPDWFLTTRAEVEEFCDCFPPSVALPHYALPIP